MMQQPQRENAPEEAKRQGGGLSFMLFALAVCVLVLGGALVLGIAV